jgi:hypothetical protein
MSIIVTPKVERQQKREPLKYGAPMVAAAALEGQLRSAGNGVEPVVEVVSIRFNKLGANHLQGFDWSPWVLGDDWEQKFAFDPNFRFSIDHQFKSDEFRVHEGSYYKGPRPIWNIAPYLLNSYANLILCVVQKQEGGNYRLWILVLLPSEDGAPERLAQGVDSMRMPLSYQEADRQQCVSGLDKAWQQLEDNCKLVAERVLRPAGIYGYADALRSAHPNGATVEIFGGDGEHELTKVSISFSSDRPGYVCMMRPQYDPSSFLSFESDGSYGSGKVVDFFGSMADLQYLHKNLLDWGEHTYAPPVYRG